MNAEDGSNNTGQGQTQTGYFVPTGPAYEPERVNLLRFWETLVNQRLLIVVCTLGVAVLAAVAAFLMTPVYRAQVVMVPADTEEVPGGLSSLVGTLGALPGIGGLDLSGGSRKDEAIATLKSRSFTDDFITEQNLLPVLFAKDWDAENERWSDDDVSEHPTLWDGYKKFEEKIRTVSVSPTTGIVTLTVDWKDREEGARWANLMVERVNERMRGRAIEEARESVEYLEQELGRASVVDLQQAIFRLMETQLNKQMLANVRKEFSFRVIDPAVPADDDEHVKPKRALMIAVGLVLGFVGGVFLAFMRALLADLRRGARTVGG